MKCLNCDKEHNNSKFCSRSCANSFNNRRRILTEETKRKISEKKKGKGKKHTEETKKKISDIMKIKSKGFSRKKSIPCDYLKNILIEKNIFFVEEFKVVENRNYQIDIAFPQYKIGIEVNGNQHYKRNVNDLILDDYYMERHNNIENTGWKLYEIYYKTVYDKNILNLINSILANKEFEYDISTKNYIIKCVNKKIFCKKCGNEIKWNEKCQICFHIKEEETKIRKERKEKKILEQLERKKLREEKKKEKIENKYNLCKCGRKKLNFTSCCSYCSHFKQRKVDRPTYNQLVEEVKEYGYSAIGRKYGVSDKTISKWIKFYEKMEINRIEPQ